MTRTLQARRLAPTAPLARLPRITPTPAEHDMLRDMALVMRLTAKVSADIRRGAKPHAEAGR